MKFLEFDETRDFPFYNLNPQISNFGWVVLLLSVPVAYVTYGLFGSGPGMEIIGSIVFCLIMLLPLLYFSNWDYALIFRKPTKNEIILGVLLFLGYMVYSLIVGTVLDTFSLSGMSLSSASSMGINVESTIGLIFSMMGEELFKFIPLMFLMRVVYKFSENRNLAVAISTTIVLIVFALLHYNPPTNTLVSVLLLQGLGSLFEMYGYLKTKNIFVSYLSHFLTDAVSFILIMLWA